MIAPCPPPRLIPQAEARVQRLQRTEQRRLNDAARAADSWQAAYEAGWQGCTQAGGQAPTGTATERAAAKPKELSVGAVHLHTAVTDSKQGSTRAGSSLQRALAAARAEVAKC